MSRFRRILLTALVIGSASGAIWCAFWQLRRLEARRVSNTALRASRDLPPIDLTAALAGQAPIEGRHITVTGHFLGSKQVLLRARVQNEVPGLHVVTPFTIRGGMDGLPATLWVMRGFVPSPDAATPPKEIAAPQEGEVTLTGLALAIPVTTDAGQPLEIQGASTWRRMDSTVLMNLLPGSFPWYLHLEGTDSGPGRLRIVPEPTFDEGPHLSYAIQWFGIAGAILAFGWFVIRKRAVDSAS